MDEISAIVLLPTSSSNPEIVKTVRDKLKSKTDLLLTAGLQQEGNGTVLQNTIESLVSVSLSTAGVAILLSFQAENLPDAHVNKFLIQCKEFFAVASSAKKHIIICHKEGLFAFEFDFLESFFYIY